MGNENVKIIQKDEKNVDVFSIVGDVDIVEL
jgi:hypothetical protein